MLHSPRICVVGSSAVNLGQKKEFKSFKSLQISSVNCTTAKKKDYLTSRRAGPSFSPSHPLLPLRQRQQKQQEDGNGRERVLHSFH